VGEEVRSTELIVLPGGGGEEKMAFSRIHKSQNNWKFEILFQLKAAITFHN